MATSTDEIENQVLDSVDRFIEQHLEPRAAEIDDKDEYPQDLHNIASDLGLFGLAIPEAYGGVDVSFRTRLFVIERICRSSASFACLLSAWPDGLAPLLEYGTDELKQRLLPKTALGEFAPAFGLSEPDAGSDAAALKTHAVRDGDSYILNGTKTWITHGGFADYVTVFAKTDQTVGHRGITAFLVEKGTPGFNVIRDEKLTGLRGSPQSTLEFVDTRIPASNRLSDEGAGFKIAMAALDEARLNCSAQALGIAYRAIQEATAFAQNRKAFGQSIIEFQGVHFLLAELCTEYAAARALWLQAIFEYETDRSRRSGIIGSMAKNACSAIGMKAPIEAIQICGAMGLHKDMLLERLMRDAKAYQIFDGTTQIHNLIIGRYLQKEGLPFE
ncbi:MAG: acyl-CoA dehydrogenase family protein [Thalassospira sp.]|uniref:acyl-CoA dehydrogenase family protein n=1 Tax=Thalassospira sp. TaxID=1912094 RepID=UPI003A871E4D